MYVYPIFAELINPICCFFCTDMFFLTLLADRSTSQPMADQRQRFLQSSASHSSEVSRICSTEAWPQKIPRKTM